MVIFQREGKKQGNKEKGKVLKDRKGKKERKGGTRKGVGEGDAFCRTKRRK